MNDIDTSMIKVLQRRNADLYDGLTDERKQRAALESALHEIELNTEGACVELGQANWKMEQVNKVARAALAAGK